MKREIVIVCFGTPEISGDSLGPEVGSLLSNRFNVNAFVYGTLTRPVTAKNMHDAIAFVKEVHRDALVLCVDASLGKKDRLGAIVTRSDGVCPAGAGGATKRFGDVGVLAVVAEGSKGALSSLLSVNSLYVAQLALKVAFVIEKAVSDFNKSTVLVC